MPSGFYINVSRTLENNKIKIAIFFLIVPKKGEFSAFYNSITLTSLLHNFLLSNRHSSFTDYRDLHAVHSCLRQTAYSVNTTKILKECTFPSIYGCKMLYGVGYVTFSADS